MRSPGVLIAMVVAVAACGGDAAPTTTVPTSASSVPPSTTTSPEATVPATSADTTPSTTEAPPETTETTEPVPVEPEFVMTIDGFAEFGVLGDDAGAVVSAVTTSFGEPTADSGWIEEHGCAFEGGMRTIVWIEPGMRLVFVDGESEFGSGQHLAAYSTVLPVRPPWEMEGVRRDMALDEVLEHFPQAEVLPGAALDYIQFVPEFPSYAWIDAAGQIREFWGGAAYCGD